MYCMGVGHVELMVMLFVSSVKHLYHSPSQLFVYCEFKPHSQKLVGHKNLCGIFLVTEDVLKKVKCQYFKIYFFLCWSVAQNLNVFINGVNEIVFLSSGIALIFCHV